MDSEDKARFERMEKHIERIDANLEEMARPVENKQRTVRTIIEATSFGASIAGIAALILQLFGK
jgi:hypothetical protein